MIPDPKLGVRQLKRRVGRLLRQDNFGQGLLQICQLPARQVVNPLFSFLYSLEAEIKWRAVTAMGAVVAGLAEQNLESARIVMRRFIWNLNDESGGIGWGSPEAMGEIMARHPRLAEEYACMLVSYIRPDGNYLEHEALQRGVLWGLGRLAHNRPSLVKDAVPFLVPPMQAHDASLRGHAAWAAGALADPKTRPALEQLASDNRRLQIYLDGQLVERTVSELAREALSRTLSNS
ncbi:MAG: HEAT repeat domain-containing protein [Desulfobacterales bacterium]|nr:MAG: HEAT repeat domain-containing protein [Desulfobacterales bacterium]